MQGLIERREGLIQLELEQMRRSGLMPAPGYFEEHLRAFQQEIEDEEARQSPPPRMPGEAITYDWLLEHGFYKLERFERQPTDHVRRPIGLETIQQTRFLACSEDLCIDLAPERWPNPGWWFCWVTKSHARQMHASKWIHVRHMHTVAEVELLYEGLTGRRLTPFDWRERELGPSCFIDPPF